MLFFMTAALGHILQDDVLTTGQENYSFSEVCSKLVAHESPLIEAVSGTELDCMGTKVQVGKFCEKVLSFDPYYIRAYVSRENKKVVCQSGKKVLFKFACVKKRDRLCEGSPKETCMQLQEKLAKRLDLVHASLQKNDKGMKQLNCFYDVHEQL